MKLLKSALNAIGSGAGVAWPLYGIVFSVLGGAVASFFSLTFGIISISLFFAVGIPIFYFSYQEMKKNEEIFQAQLDKNQQKLLTDIQEYISSIDNYALYEKCTADFNEVFARILIMDLNKIARESPNSPLCQILSLFYEEYKLKQAIPNNKVILEHIVHNVSQHSVPLSKKIVPSFFAFVGTFGPIAGCSAGVSGLLTGMGLFSSFAAFPLLGWGILTVALISGIIMASEAIIQSSDDFKKNELNQTIKNMHSQLSKATMERDLNTRLCYPFLSLKEQSKEKRSFEPIKQPIFPNSFINRASDKKPKLTFLSFFNMNQSFSSSAQDEVNVYSPS
ncbi:Uncharacterised protein [Legionella steigerwaltii]|uniref:Uncharacterized protein n=1 Tax=Legionella steigerwaltii TaxID=460 RepID=A0A378LFV0_9GAMM|nr:hypothetical protein [Legionella steigerwaltii]KTD79467.1 hypothetical protein Lstg_0683 [Legionella steigerwaltii]STY24649.1 Uncharacterised protein [Legionella steigerwaltii]